MHHKNIELLEETVEMTVNSTMLFFNRFALSQTNPDVVTNYKQADAMKLTIPVLLLKRPPCLYPSDSRVLAQVTPVF